MPEHRKHPRKELHPPVAYQIGDGPRTDAICHDISLGGMFIETAQPAAFGSKVVVYISLPALKGVEAKVEATVRWTKPTGMGVQFAPMGARETFALTELLGG